MNHPHLKVVGDGPAPAQPTVPLNTRTMGDHFYINAPMEYLGKPVQVEVGMDRTTARTIMQRMQHFLREEPAQIVVSEAHASMLTQPN